MKKVLIVVDYQNDFVSGALGFDEAKKIDENMAKRVKDAINQNELIICTMDTHGQDYLDTLEGKLLPIPHTIKGTDGWKVYGETGKVLASDKNVIYVEKDTFGSNTLLSILKYSIGRNDCEIEIAGVITNMCVISNAVIAKTSLPNAKIKINSSLCAGPDKYLHQAALDVMKSMQMEII